MLKAVSSLSCRFRNIRYIPYPKSTNERAPFIRKYGILCIAYFDSLHSFTYSTYRIVLGSHYHSSKALANNESDVDSSVLTNELEEAYPSMVTFLDVYIDTNFDELVHLFDERKSAFCDEIYLTQSSLENDQIPRSLLTSSVQQKHTEGALYYLHHRQGQSTMSYDLEQNGNSFTQEEVKNVLKQALIQVVLDYFDGKPFGRTSVNSSNENEFLIAHYLSFRSNTSSQQFSPHESPFYSLSIPKSIIMDLLSSYKTMREKDQVSQ